MTNKEQLQRLFPKGRIAFEKKENVASIQLPLAEDAWFVLDRKDLTERELELIDMLLSDPSIEQGHPWGRYFQGIGPLPQSLEKLQVIHAHIGHVSDEDGKLAWLDMMAKLLPNLQGHYTGNGQDYMFILHQSPLLDVKEILRDTLATMEFDFGLRIVLFLGQIWPSKLLPSWPQLIEAEQSLFRHWRNSHHQSRLLTFGQLYLWAGQLYPVLGEGLTSLIAHQQLEKEIQVLWEEGAVITKAAQSLYIHRNTLQYRLDKWFDWTGLQLKELTDLAVCYMVIMDLNV
ncbi:TPA: helix-turn-helix domain-containing protein [Streptococcus suis]